MEKKLFILQRVGEKYDYDTRGFEIYNAPIDTLVKFGLTENNYDNSVEFSISFDYNVNTGEFDFKNYLRNVQIHSGNLELILDNNGRLKPTPIPYGHTIAAHYDKYFNIWRDNSYKEDGYRYILSKDDYLKIANSRSLSGKVEFAYLKEASFRVNDVTFQQLKDCIITRYSEDTAVIDKIYSKYQNSSSNIHEVSDGIEVPFEPVNYRGNSYKASGNKQKMKEDIRGLNVLFFLLFYPVVAMICIGLMYTSINVTTDEELWKVVYSGLIISLPIIYFIDLLRKKWIRRIKAV